VRVWTRRVQEEKSNRGRKPLKRLDERVFDVSRNIVYIFIRADPGERSAKMRIF
jgi:hypothetical protein